jgi:hypothetical protein
MKTIGFLSDNPGELTSMVDIPLLVPATDTPSVQEGHVILTHLICSLIEQTLLGDGQDPADTSGADTMRSADPDGHSTRGRAIGRQDAEGHAND